MKGYSHHLEVGQRDAFLLPAGRMPLVLFLPDLSLERGQIVISGGRWREQMCCEAIWHQVSGGGGASARGRSRGGLVLYVRATRMESLGPRPELGFFSAELGLLSLVTSEGSQPG